MRSGDGAVGCDPPPALRQVRRRLPHTSGGAAAAQELCAPQCAIAHSRHAPHRQRRALQPSIRAPSHRAALLLPPPPFLPPPPHPLPAPLPRPRSALTPFNNQESSPLRVSGRGAVRQTVSSAGNSVNYTLTSALQNPRLQQPAVCCNTPPPPPPPTPLLCTAASDQLRLPPAHPAVPVARHAAALSCMPLAAPFT